MLPATSNVAAVKDSKPPDIGLKTPAPGSKSALAMKYPGVYTLLATSYKTSLPPRPVPVLPVEMQGAMPLMGSAKTAIKQVLKISLCYALIVLGCKAQS